MSLLILYLIFSIILFLGKKEILYTKLFVKSIKYKKQESEEKSKNFVKIIGVSASLFINSNKIFSNLLSYIFIKYHLDKNHLLLFVLFFVMNLIYK